VRWGYKTVHFGLKKDGLLGSAFLDDTEIEETLNDYGRGGWELVAMLETRDGVIAVFKQLLGLHSVRASEPPGEIDRRERGNAAAISFAERKGQAAPEAVELAVPVTGAVDEDESIPEDDEEYPALDDEDGEEPEVTEPEEDDDGDAGIGSIRIE